MSAETFGNGEQYQESLECHTNFFENVGVMRRIAANSLYSKLFL